MAGTGGTTTYVAPKPVTNYAVPTQGGTYVAPKPAPAPAPKPVASQPTQGGGYTSPSMMSGSASTASKPKPTTSQPTQGGGYSSGSSGSASSGSSSSSGTAKPSAPTQGGGYSSSGSSGSSGTAKSPILQMPSGSSGSGTRSPTEEQQRQKQAMTSLNGLDAAASKMPAQSKAAIANAFMQSLAAAAKTGAAVPNPAGLTGEEADKYRSQFYTQFYSNQTVPQIIDNSAMPRPADFSALFPATTAGSQQRQPLPDLASPLYQANQYSGTGVTPYLVDQGGGQFGVGKGVNQPYMGLEFGGYEENPLGAKDAFGTTTGAADLRALDAALSPRQITPPTLPYGQGVNTIGMPQIDYGDLGVKPMGRGIDAIGMPQLDYVAPGNQRVAYSPQMVRPGVPGSMPVAPQPSYGTLGSERPGVIDSMMRDQYPNVPGDQLNARGVANRILDYVTPQRATSVSDQQPVGFDPLSLLIGQAKGDEYNPGGDTSMEDALIRQGIRPGIPMADQKLAPVPYPRPASRGTTIMPIDDVYKAMNDSINGFERFGAGIAGIQIPQSPEELNAVIQQQIKGLGTYDPKTGKVVIQDASSPAAQKALADMKANERTWKIMQPYIDAATYQRIPVPTDRPVPVDMTRPVPATVPTRSAATSAPSPAGAYGNYDPLAALAEMGVGAEPAASRSVSPTLVRPDDAVAKFGGPDLGSPYSPAYYDVPDMVPPSAPFRDPVVRSDALRDANNAAMLPRELAAMYNALGQQPGLGTAETPLMYRGVALDQAPQITSNMLRTTQPGPAGTSNRGERLFPSIDTVQRVAPDQIVGQNANPVPSQQPPVVVGMDPKGDGTTFDDVLRLAQITKTGRASSPTFWDSNGDVINTGTGLSGTGTTTTASTEDYTGSGPEGGDYVADDSGSSYQPSGGSRSSGVNDVTAYDKTTSGGDKFVVPDGQILGTNGYLYEVSGKDANGNPTYKRVGKVPGYTDAQLYKAANAGAFRDPNNVSVGKTTPKPPSALRTWARAQLDKYNAEVAKKKAEAEAKGEEYNPVSFMDYLQLAGSAATGNIGGLLMKGGAMLYPQIIEWLANGPISSGSSDGTMMDGSPSTGTRKTGSRDGGKDGGSGSGSGGSGSGSGSTGGTGTTPKPTGVDGGYTMKDFAQYLPYLTPIFPPDTYRPGIDPEWNYYRYADGGQVEVPRLVVGPGGGKDDKIPARIDGVHEARLSNGEFVITADAVRGLGGGDPQKGAQALMQLNDMFASRPDKGQLRVEKVK